jgi:hypothetical protein
MLGARSPSAGSSQPSSSTRLLEDDIGFVKSAEDTEYNQETIVSLNRVVYSLLCRG